MPKHYPQKQYGPKLCVICGKEFAPVYKCALTCSADCRRKRENALSAKRQATKAHEKRLEEETKVKPKVGMDEMLERIRQYNAAHPNEPLSYGKYNLAKEAGLLG